jgi:3-oxoadipyl-CoA thiolase
VTGMAGREVFIVDALRTPVGRHGGALAEVRPDDLAAGVVRALIARTQADPEAIDDVLFGCANQAGEDNRNVARMALLLAGLPVSVPGATVNRLCASGLQAVVDGARAIATGEADLIVAGGVESMSRAPLVMGKAREGFARGDVTAFDSTLGWRFVNPSMQALHGTDPLGETAEKVAEKYQVTRADQDAFALRSQRQWAAAHAVGRWQREVVPVEVPAAKGKTATAPAMVEVDEHPRPQVTEEELARLRPVFRKDGTVTAGNASGINDGAAAVLLASRAGLDRVTGGQGPLARFVGAAAAGVEPSLMGTGPIPATRKLLGRLQLSAAELDLIEINEAFAAQVLPCIRELGLDPERVNVNGGAIAIGHPLGCSGARLLGTLAHELHRRRVARGLVTMCIGVGQGLSAVIAAP